MALLNSLLCFLRSASASERSMLTFASTSLRRALKSASFLFNSARACRSAASAVSRTASTLETPILPSLTYITGRSDLLASEENSE